MKYHCAIIDRLPQSKNLTKLATYEIGSKNNEQD